MAKKYIHKALSVGLSLALCASLVVPSFAASFSELNDAINGSYQGDAFSVDNGKITLKEDVINTGSESSIIINKDVTLDLGGWSIDQSQKNSGSTIWVDGGNLTLEDSGRTDETGEQVSGKVTGGKASGVYVSNSGSFTMNGGEISKNSIVNNGGGVVVNAGSTFVMTGGKITGNTANGSGGGVSVIGTGASFEMKGGEISGNTANGGANSGGSGVHVWKGGSFTLDGGKVFASETEIGAKGNSVAVHQGASFTMKTGELRGNVTVEDVTGANEVDIQGGNVSSLDKKYYGDEKGTGLADNGNGTFKVVPHNAENGTHYYGENVTFQPGQTYTCLVCGNEHAEPAAEEPSVPVVPPVTPDEPVIDLEEDVIDIDDPAVPLAAGPVTRGEFIDYLWRHEDQPQAAAPTYVDVPADHEYASAIGWAQSIGILERVVVENSLDPDELVTVSAVRDILIEFAEYAGMEMPELTTLMGEDDEAVLNCDEILAEFFGEEPAE